MVTARTFRPSCDATEKRSMMSISMMSKRFGTNLGPTGQTNSVLAAAGDRRFRRLRPLPRRLGDPEALANYRAAIPIPPVEGILLGRHPRRGIPERLSPGAPLPR